LHNKDYDSDTNADETLFSDSLTLQLAAIYMIQQLRGTCFNGSQYK